MGGSLRRNYPAFAASSFLEELRATEYTRAGCGGPIDLYYTGGGLYAPSQREPWKPRSGRLSLTVCRQVECGIEIVTDGELSKTGFFTSIRERLEGFESRPNQKLLLFEKEVAMFPEYYTQYFKEAMIGSTRIVPVVCTEPVKYRGEAAVQPDIANVKAVAKVACRA